MFDVPASDGAVAPYLRGDGDGVLATWLESVPDGAHRLRVARWQGSAWTVPTTIAESAGIVANWADVPTIARAGDGALVASWAEASAGGEAYDVVVARSIDGGATWMRLGPLHADRSPAEHGFVSMTAEGTGLRAFWLDGRDAKRAAGATALRTALISATIGGEAVVDDRVCDCCATAAATTDAGSLVAFRDRSEAEIRDIAIARPGGAAWSAGSVASDGWEILGCPVNGPAAAARGRVVVVAWFTNAHDARRVRVAFSTDSGGSFSPAIDVDVPAGGRAPIGRVGVVLDDDGTALVSWVASAREDATVLVRRVAADGRRSAELPIVRAKAGRDGGFPRMARTGGEFVIVWTEPAAPSRLRAARLLLSAVPAVDHGAEIAVSHRAAAGPGAGAPAPTIAAMTLDEAPVELASLRGHVVLVNLWATWCEPCRQEMPGLAALQDAYRSQGLIVVGIDVDRDKRADEIAAFAARRSATYTIWLDPQDRASAALGVSSYPVTILVDRKGTIAWRRDGVIAPNDPGLRIALDDALRP